MLLNEYSLTDSLNRQRIVDALGPVFGPVLVERIAKELINIQRYY